MWQTVNRQFRLSSFVMINKNLLEPNFSNFNLGTVHVLILLTNSTGFSQQGSQRNKNVFSTVLSFFYSVEKRFYYAENLVEKSCWSTELTHERYLSLKSHIFPLIWNLSSVSDVTIFHYHYYNHYHNSGCSSCRKADFLPICRVVAILLQ